MIFYQTRKTSPESHHKSTLYELDTYSSHLVLVHILKDTSGIISRRQHFRFLPITQSTIYHHFAVYFFVLFLLL